jgi:hypothetical protein
MVLEKEASYVDAQEAARILGVNKRAVRNFREATLRGVAGECGWRNNGENNERLPDAESSITWLLFADTRVASFGL